LPHDSGAWWPDVPTRTLIDDLRFAENRILVEQLRLLLGNVISSTLPVFVLSALMVLTLSNEQNIVLLMLWFAVVVLSKLASFIVARYYLNTTIRQDQAHMLAWSMVGFYAINGLAWGTLPWLTFDTATPAGKVITLSLMAGVIGSAMAQTSSVLSVFFSFAVTTLTLVGIKLLQLDDPAYTAFAAATLLYFVSLLPLARNNSAAALAAIRLRFENSKLLERLRVESETADIARREAEEANTAKSKFLAAASHDLRQPIHSQGLFISVLANTPLDTQQRELVENIRQSSESSRDMLNTLLDFSRIDAGVIKPQKKTFRLQPLLYKLESELAPLADTKGLVYRTRESAFSVNTDPALLELILRNLILNAIRYTDRGGILIATRRRGGRCSIEIWDTGVGIQPDQQGVIFREFHQLGNPERDSRKGLGLGLAISDGLARTLGHDITLESCPGRGSVFRLSVDFADELLLEDIVEATERPVSTITARVLVVDDEASVRDGMRHLLAAWGAEVETAEGLGEARAIVADWEPNLIISDYRLRDQQTGGETIRALREQLGEETPALLITGDTAPERLREAQAGGVPLLHKPVSPEQLHYYVAKLVEESAVHLRAQAPN